MASVLVLLAGACSEPIPFRPYHAWLSDHMLLRATANGPNLDLQVIDFSRCEANRVPVSVRAPLMARVVDGSTSSRFVLELAYEGGRYRFLMFDSGKPAPLDGVKTRDPFSDVFRILARSGSLQYLSVATREEGGLRYSLRSLSTGEEIVAADTPDRGEAFAIPKTYLVDQNLLVVPELQFQNSPERLDTRWYVRVVRLEPFELVERLSFDDWINLLIGEVPPYGVLGCSLDRREMRLFLLQTADENDPSPIRVSYLDAVPYAVREHWVGCSNGRVLWYAPRESSLFLTPLTTLIVRSLVASAPADAPAFDTTKPIKLPLPERPVEARCVEIDGALSIITRDDQGRLTAWEQTPEGWKERCSIDCEQDSRPEWEGDPP